MKILQINKFYYRRRGAEAYFLDLCEMLTKHGHEVAVFSMKHPENIKTKYSKYFVSNIELANIKFNIKAAGRIFWSFEAARKLEQLIIDFKPDVVHIHNIYHQISPSVLLILKKHKIPVVMTLHDYKIMCPNYKMFRNNQICEHCKGGKYYHCAMHKCVKNSRAASTLAMFEMYFHKYMQIYERSVDCFIAPSMFMKNKLHEWKIKAKMVESLYNFIKPVEKSNTSVKGNFILYMGGLVPEKGVDQLLDIFKVLNYDIKLYIAGSGVLETVLKKIAKDNKKIIFLGHLKPEQIQEYLSNCLFTVLPCQWYENNPLSVIESMQAGKPVVSMDVGGISEIIEHNKNGLLAKLNDVEDFKKQIFKLIEEPNLRNKLGANAKISVAEKFNEEKHYAALLPIYEKLVKHKK